MTGGAPLSFSGMLAQADLVVQAVVALLVICSVACWAIIIRKVVQVAALRRAIAGVEAYATSPGTASASSDTLLDRLLAELHTERAVPGPDIRPRLETALRLAGLREVRAGETGLPFLATVASTAPFVGLFGTVWGIMHSFTAIAAAQDTSLASVAPGIAEALLATAIGLAVAIPAVVGYNQIRAAFARCGQRLAAVAAVMARTATAP